MAEVKLNYKKCSSCKGSGRKANATGILIALGTFGGSVLASALSGGDDITDLSADCGRCGGSGREAYIAELVF